MMERSAGGTKHQPQRARRRFLRTQQLVNQDASRHKADSLACLGVESVKRKEK